MGYRRGLWSGLVGVLSTLSFWFGSKGWMGGLLSVERREKGSMCPGLLIAKREGGLRSWVCKDQVKFSKTDSLKMTTVKSS